MNFNDVLREFLITLEHERRRPFTMSLFKNLEVREPSGNDEEQEGRERRGERKKRGERAALRSHPFPKMGYKFPREIFPIIREIVRKARFASFVSWQRKDSLTLFNFCYVSRE